MMTFANQTSTDPPSPRDSIRHGASAGGHSSRQRRVGELRKPPLDSRVPAGCASCVAPALVERETKKGPTACRRRPITPSSSQMRPGGEAASRNPPGPGHGGVGLGLGVGPWRHIGVGSFERSMIQSDYACIDSEFTRRVLIFNCSVSTVVALFAEGDQISRLRGFAIPCFVA
jgi:hypothetical protein